MEQPRFFSNTGRTLRLYELLLIVCAVCGIFHVFYFLLAPFIWSQNLPVNPQAITPWVRPWIDQHDGIELYALYTLIFACLTSSLVIAWLWARITNRVASGILFMLLVAVSCCFFSTIGFNPPVSTLAVRSIPLICEHSLLVSVLLAPLLLILLIMRKRITGWWVNMAVLVLLMPVCFIAVQPIAWKDYAYVLAPALRLLHGANLSEIYFQYDPLLSLPAWVWMKLHLDLNLFQVVGQASYLIYLFSLFLLAKKLFADEKLPFFFLLALVLIRMYATFDDPVGSFQVTPLRLDWWLPVLVLVYRFGPYHWSAGLFCGFMILVNKNFGIIYTLAYFQLLFTLVMLDGFAGDGRNGQGTWPVVLAQTLKKLRLNLAVIAAAGVAVTLLFWGPDAASVYYYQKIGIGFIRIAQNSFYWYVPVIICLVFSLILRLWNAMPRNKLIACLFLIYLAIGNSLYFFGRSHEHNILHISGSLLLLFFLVLDLTKSAAGNGALNPAMQFVKRHRTDIGSVAFLLLIIISYGDRISAKAVLQARNAAHYQMHYRTVSQEIINEYLNKFRTVTGKSEKVFFACRDIDVIFYYYGGYAPMGFFNPYTSWLFTRDLERFLQGLLDTGYFIVVDGGDYQEGLYPLVYNNTTRIDNFVIMWKGER